MVLVILRVGGALALFTEKSTGKSLLSLAHWHWQTFHFLICDVVATSPIYGNVICVVHSYRLTLYAYAIILAVEVIFLGMALRQAWMHRASEHGSPLMRRLSRDSVFYFSM